MGTNLGKRIGRLNMGRKRKTYSKMLRSKWHWGEVKGVQTMREVGIAPARNRPAFGCFFVLTCFWAWIMFKTFIISWVVFQEITDGRVPHRFIDVLYLVTAVSFPFLTIFAVVMTWRCWWRNRNGRALLWMLIPPCQLFLGYFLFVSLFT